MNGPRTKISKMNRWMGKELTLKLENSSLVSLFQTQEEWNREKSGCPQTWWVGGDDEGHF